MPFKILDLPLPLGPTMTVSRSSNVISASFNALKFWNLARVIMLASNDRSKCYHTAPRRLSRGVAGVYSMRFCSSWFTASRYCSVVKYGVVSPISSARSLVILPDSTRSTQTFSTVSANFTTSGVWSILPR